MPSNTRIQVRRGNASSWVSVNPILSQGEFGYEVDTGKLKVGDGQNAWNSLTYFPVEWSALNGKPAVIAAGSTQAAARASISAASLDANGKVPVSELPSSIMQYQGVYNAATNSPSLSNGTGDTGDVYRVSVAGSRNFGAGAISLDVGDYVIYNGSVWEKSDTTDAVSTVAGRTGDVTLTKADVGLSNVDNTSDAAKNLAQVTLTNKTLSNPTISGYGESVVALGTVGATATLSITSGTMVTATLTASTATTFTMPTAPSSTPGLNFVLFLRQPAATGGGSATFTGVKWGSAGAPTITTGAGKMDILSFFAPGDGNWYGSITPGFTP